MLMRMHYFKNIVFAFGWLKHFSYTLLIVSKQQSTFTSARNALCVKSEAISSNGLKLMWINESVYWNTNLPCFIWILWFYLLMLSLQTLHIIWADEFSYFYLCPAHPQVWYTEYGMKKNQPSTTVKRKNSDFTLKSKAPGRMPAQFSKNSHWLGSTRSNKICHWAGCGCSLLMSTVGSIL